ncbi:MAG: biliverdin-producing heme oxygenase [Sphingobacterium sp.]
MLNEQIKHQTKDGHQTLEKLVVQRLKSIQNNEDYADLLKYFYAYFLNLEKGIAAQIPPSLSVFFQHRRNANHIAQDIKELGFSLENLPQTELPPIINKNQAIGALYVLEGSIMGGPYIVKMLQQRGIEKGFNFFNGYGEQSGQKWGEFTGIINSEIADENDIEETILSAKNTFQQFTNTFNNQINA